MKDLQDTQNFISLKIDDYLLLDGGAKQAICSYTGIKKCPFVSVSSIESDEWIDFNKIWCSDFWTHDLVAIC